MTNNRRLQVQGVVVGLISLAMIIAIALLVSPGAVRAVLLALAVLTYLGGKAATFGFSPATFAECWRSSWFFRANVVVAGPIFVALMVAAGVSSAETPLRNVAVAVLVGVVVLLRDPVTDLFRQRDQPTQGRSVAVRQPVG